MHMDEGNLGIAEMRSMVRAGILGSSWECVDAIIKGQAANAYERLSGVRREESAFSFLWKLGYTTGNTLSGRGGNRPGGSNLPSTSQDLLAQLLQGCYQWEWRMKSGRWSGRHDFVALEGLIAGHALRRPK